MQKFDIKTKKTYVTKEGVEKTFWGQVGTLMCFDEEKYSLELNIFPDTKFYLFPVEKKEE